jgi:hypothetical protein
VVVTDWRVYLASGSLTNPVDVPVTYWSAAAAELTAPPSEKSGSGISPTPE